MRRLLTVLFCLVVTVWVSGQQKGPAKKLVSITGEIVDLHCYVTREAKGEEHAGCGNACIARGVPVGILTADRKVYLLLDGRPFSVKDKVEGKVGKKVTLRGTLVARGGLNALQLETAE